MYNVYIYIKYYIYNIYNIYNIYMYLFIYDIYEYSCNTRFWNKGTSNNYKFPHSIKLYINLELLLTLIKCKDFYEGIAFCAN